MLVTQRPEATAAILMQLCTAGESEDEFVAEVASFTHLFDDRWHCLSLQDMSLFHGLSSCTDGEEHVRCGFPSNIDSYLAKLSISDLKAC